MTLEEILAIAKREVALPEPRAMQHLLLLLADDSARFMRRTERPTGSGLERRQAAHTIPIEDCHRILLRSLRLVGDLRVQPAAILEVFKEWRGMGQAGSMVPAQAHRFRQGVEGAVIAKFDFEADGRVEPVQESALGVFRAAAQLAAAAQDLTPERFVEQLAVQQAA